MNERTDRIIDSDEIRVVTDAGAGIVQSLGPDGQVYRSMGMQIYYRRIGEGTEEMSPYYVFGQQELAYFLSGMIQHLGEISPQTLVYLRALLDTY